ncbi:MAG: hypothetical protein RIF33_04115 [Cyclobacteriaceae bacterium]
MSLDNRPELTLCIVNAFDGASFVYSNISGLNLVKLNVIFLKGYMAVFPGIWRSRIDRLYIDTDIGFWRRLLIFLSMAKETVVYEEGFGTYDIFRFGPMKMIHSYFGSFFMTNFLMVYHPEKLHPTVAYKGCAFSQSLQKFIETNWDLMKIIMRNPENDQRINSIKGNVSIYVTRRNLDKRNLSELDAQYDGKILVRPHPGLVDELEPKYILSNAYFSGEMEVLNLLVNPNISSVRLYHHGTSMERYIQHPSLQYIEVDLIKDND